MNPLEFTSECDSCKYVKYSYDGGSTRCKRKDCEYCPKGKEKYFVIYLYAFNYELVPTESGNDYGYYASEYTVQGELYPACDTEVTGRTKRYKNHKSANKAAERLLNRYGYVVKSEVREVFENE